MKKNYKIFIVLLTVCSIMMLATGCWDYKEISDKIIVAGAAIDYDEENKDLLLTVEIILPTESGKESNFIPKIYQSSGKNMIEAARNVSSKTGHVLLWSHSKIIILDKELFKAENLFTGILDWIKRDLESRQNIHLIMSTEKTAGEILIDSSPQTEQVVSFYLDHLFNSTNENGFLVKTSYWQFMDSLNSTSGCSALPCIQLQDSETGKIPYLINTELLNNLDPIYTLNNSQTKILLMTTNKLSQVMFILSRSNYDTTENITFELLDVNTSMEPTYVENQLSMIIKISSEVEITEIDSNKDIFSPVDIKDLENNLKFLIASDVKKFINVLQNNETDVLGFANKINEKYPNVWKKLEINWKNEFKNIPLNIEADFKITSSNQSMKRTKAGK